MNGVLPVYKPANMSSAQVVARVKKYLKVKKAGHTGTLDPFATGLVLVALGKATRIAQFLLKSEKTYFATVLLGTQTDTYDRTGQVTSMALPAHMESITQEQVKKAVFRFLGVQEQIAPSFSALKHEGQPLYKLARKGVMITKPPRPIEIFKIDVARMDLPEVDLIIQCSAGTYIRSIAHDLGKMLGCGAHLKDLIRTASGAFTLDRALPLEPVSSSQDSSHKEEFQNLARTRMVSMSQSLSFLPEILAHNHLVEKIRHGQPIHEEDAQIDMDKYQENSYFRIVDKEDDLLAVVSFDRQRKQFVYSCVLTG